MNGKTIKEILESFLTEEDFYKIEKQIKQFPNINNFYDLQNNYEFIAQGDGIIDRFEIYEENTKLTIFQKALLKFFDKKFILGEKKKITAFIISNTCDMDENNIRKFYQTNILFSPIIQLKKYKEILKKRELTTNEIDSHINDIKNNNITAVFYLPSGSIEESIVFLDRIYNYPSNLIDRTHIQEKRCFGLSLVAFYLLLTKLIIHFSRPGELLKRNI